MPRFPVDHQASRAESYRRHAVELATEARRENDPGRQRDLLDLARTYWNVADQLAPLPLDEPQIFRMGFRR
jgi:hypothetical protein